MSQLQRLGTWMYSMSFGWMETISGHEDSCNSRNEDEKDIQVSEVWRHVSSVLECSLVDENTQCQSVLS